MNELIVIFDFDHSLIDENSDTFIFEVLSPKLVQELLDYYKKQKQGWTASVNYALDKLHQQNFKQVLPFFF